MAKVIRPQHNGGLGLGGLQNKNLALLAKWGWRVINEENFLFRQDIRSIPGKKPFNWHTVGSSLELLVFQN